MQLIEIELKASGHTLRRIRDLVDERKVFGKKSHFSHVYSHLLDKKESQLNPKQILNLKEMKNKFPDDWNKILNLNKGADKATLSKTSVYGIQLNLVTNGINKYQLTNTKFGVILGNLIKIVEDDLKNRNKSNWRLRCPTRTKAKYDVSINWIDSIYPIHTNFDDRILSNIQQKTKQSMLPTKVLMCKRYSKMKNDKFKSDAEFKKLKNRYKDNFCSFCKTLKLSIEENHHHILGICPEAKRYNKDFAELIREKIKNDSKRDINTFPFWFTLEKEFGNYYYRYAALSIDFKEKGDRGYIPSFLKELLKDFISEDLIKDTYSFIVKESAINLLKKWKNRNKRLIEVDG